MDLEPQHEASLLSCFAIAEREADARLGVWAPKKVPARATALADAPVVVEAFTSALPNARLSSDGPRPTWNRCASVMSAITELYPHAPAEDPTPEALLLPATPTAPVPE